ncbi:cytokinin dehydrogenase 3-like protein [Tanacetum coccineum]
MRPDFGGVTLNRNKKHTASGISVSTDSEDTMNDDTPIGVASVIREGVTPSVVDMTVKMIKQNSLDDTTVPGSFPPLSKPVTTTAGNAPGKSLYANITGKPSGKKVNVRTLYTPRAYDFFLGKKVEYPVVANYVRNTWGKYGLVRSIFSSSTMLFSFQFNSMDGLDDMLENGPWFIQNNPLILKKWHPDENLLKEDVSTVPIWVKLHGVPVTAFSEDGLSVIATKLGTPLMLDSYTSDMCMQSLGRSSYARVMIKLRADVELRDNIFVAMPKITREGHYTCNICVEYEWKPPRYSSCKVFGHIHEECLKNTSLVEKKTVKKPSQTSQGVPVGPKIGFKPQKEYRHVPKKPNASSSGNKKKGVEPTIEVSNSNPFDVLNSVDNDVEFGTNGGTTNLVNNGATSSGSSFMNIDNDGEFASNTPIGEKIDKIERQICEGKLRLLDNDGNPLVPSGIVESDSEVEVVFDETANLRISTSGKDGSDKGYGTNSLLEQWRDSYPDNDDYDPYDDDMYENHDLSEHLQSICDDLDITPPSIPLLAGHDADKCGFSPAYSLGRVDVNGGDHSLSTHLEYHRALPDNVPFVNNMMVVDPFELSLSTMAMVNFPSVLNLFLQHDEEDFISSACRQTHCKHTAEDDLEVFSTDDLGLDWISAHNFLTRLQKLSSYASSHLEVSEKAACLEKASFSCASGHVKVF